MNSKKVKSYVKCINCGSNNTNLDYDFPQSITDCDNCGCEFITDTKEIVLNPILM